MPEIKLHCGTKVRLDGKEIITVTVQAQEPDIFFVSDNNSRLTFQIWKTGLLELRKLISEFS